MKLPQTLLRRLDEAAARAEAIDVRPVSLIDDSFPMQKAFLLDDAQMITALCTRRAAKSFSAGMRLIRAGMKHPGSSCLFIALTRESAKKILWKDVLLVINRRWKLGARFNKSELSMTLTNGSKIYLLGVDADEEEMQKLLGQKYAEVVIDESASYSIDLRSLVYDVLKPAVADYRGTICLVGTPGNLKSGLFFELTDGQDPTTPGRWRKNGFSGHRWSTLDNPYMRDAWLAEIAQLIADNPLIEETPGFQQNYRGRWVVDESALVYRYQKVRNDYDGTLPAMPRGEWHYVLGVDLGFNDATSFTVAAYHDHLRDLFVVSSSKQSGLDITDAAERMNALRSRFDVEATVIDGSNKQAVEELNKRHGVAAVPAEKPGKFEFIDIMNAEFIQGRIKLSPDCEPLKDEYQKLVLDERALRKSPPKRVEHPNAPNHCADSTLYAWRYTWQYLSEPIKERPAKNTVEYVQQQRAEQQAEVDTYFEGVIEQHQHEQRDEMELESWL